VLVVAHKVVSKAEGACVALAGVVARTRARERWPRHGKDPRHVQVVLDETRELVRAERGVLICRTRHGFVCANAGVDASNAPRRAARPPAARPGRERARACAPRCPPPAVVIADSFGARVAHGQCEVAIGRRRACRRSTTGAGAATAWAGSCARRGSRSPTRPRRPADLVRDKDSREPAVVVRGLERHVTPRTARAPRAPAPARPTTSSAERRRFGMRLVVGFAAECRRDPMHPRGRAAASCGSRATAPSSHASVCEHCCAALAVVDEFAYAPARARTPRR
jgi:coenzyme F420-0:L-glutamate ligase/coenzyme F420-1:gamma-L-glutamate ligase